MPVANLQSYGTVALRVQSQAFGYQAPALEAATLGHLRQTCGFTQIGRLTKDRPVDVVLDLNITSMGRGGDNRFIKNPNEATVDTLLVLTDGQSGELLGTARIHGSSSGMVTNGAPPEREALDAVASAVSDLLAKSGCSGPRVARVEAPPTPTPTPTPAPGSAAPPAEDHRAEADALNAQGTEKLQGADEAGALALFQQANQMAPDPRYVFNACLTLESEQQWDQATAACKQARTMNPQPALLTKIDHRLDLLAQHQ